MAKQKEVKLFQVVRKEEGQYSTLSLRVGVNEIVGPEIRFCWYGSKDIPYWYALEVKANISSPSRIEDFSKFWSRFQRAFGKNQSLQPAEVVAWLQKQGYQEAQYHDGLLGFVPHKEWPEKPIWAAVYEEEGRETRITYKPAANGWEALQTFRKAAARAIETNDTMRRYWLKWIEQREQVKCIYEQVIPWQEVSLEPPGAQVVEQC